jgi:aminomethyltransferase
MPERRTPLYDIHRRTASKMVKGGGDFMYPLSYVSPMEEHKNTRTNVGMQDLSTMGEVDIKGPGAERLIRRLVVNEIVDMEPRQIRYTTMCNPEGGIVDDVTVYKFGDEHFMIITSSGPRKKTARWIADHGVGMSAYANDLTGAIALISVQGPRSRDFLSKITSELDLETLPFFRFGEAVINETELLISRTGYTGELGYELYTPAEEVAALWEYLEKEGKAFGLMPYGVTAMQSLRVEKAFPLYGPDINEDVTPFHLGLDRWIRFDKRQFIGRDALLRLQDAGLDERWVGLTLEGEVAAKTGDPITSIADISSFREQMFTGSEAGDEFDAETAGEQVGEVTSSARGYSVDKTLALGFVRTTHAWPGAKLLVAVNGRPTVATITSTPFFDPGGVRMRARGPRKV